MDGWAYMHILTHWEEAERGVWIGGEGCGLDRYRRPCESHVPCGIIMKFEGVAARLQRKQARQEGVKSRYALADRLVGSEKTFL